MSTSKDASDTIHQRKQRVLFADKAVQESALLNNIKNHLTLEGVPNAPMTYTPYFNNILNGETQTTPEELAAYKASAIPSVPDAPYGVNAAPDDASARVTFTPPTYQGSAPITSFTVTANPGGATAVGVIPPLTVNGLTNGTAYTFTVIATNSVGNSDSSTVSNSVIPSGVPGAPTITSITRFDITMEIYFTAGAANGSAVTNYEYSLDNGSTWTQVIPWSTSSPISILVNVIPTYTVRIRAVNRNGSGPQSNAVTSTGAALPGAPTIVEGTSADSQISFTFTAGTTGGATITNYEYSTDDGASWTTRNPASVSSPITIMGLTNNTGYKIKLRAVNVVGSGTASSTLYISPLPFSGLQLFLDAAKFQSDVSGATTWYDYSGKSKHATFNALTSWASGNGGRLNFNGTNQFATVPSGFADFTTGITVLAIADFGDTSEWERIIDFGTGQQGNNILLGRRGMSATDVFFEIYNGASSGFAAAKNFITNNQWNVFGGRLDGTTYAMIDATNITSTGQLGGSASFLPNNVTRTSNFIGKSNWSSDDLFQRRMAVLAIFNTALSDAQITQFIDYHRSRFTPAAPTALTATPGSTQAQISFTAGSDNGNAITNYLYSIDGTTYTLLSPAVATSPITITGLTNGQPYSITLKAVNAFGASVASSSVSVTPTAPEALGAPTLTYALPANGGAYIYFTAGSGTPTNYQYTTDSGTSYTSFSPAEILSPVYISGLINGTAYTIQLRATATGTESSLSNSMAVTPNSNSVPSEWLYYDPNNGSSYSGTGSSVNNIGSYGSFTGTKSGGVTYVTGAGISRNVFDFSGSGTTISFSALDFGASFTISAWVYPRDKYSINGLLTTTGPVPSISGFKVAWNSWQSTDKRMLFEAGNGSTWGAPASSLDTIVFDTWQYLTFVFDKASNRILMFKNGTPIDISSISTVANVDTNAESGFLIGAYVGGSYSMNAQLGMIKVYNSTLDASQVLADYNATKAGFGL